MNISVTYKIYHRSCDFSTRPAWVCSNRWMDCGGRSGFATSTQQECTVYSYERQFVKLCLQKNRKKVDNQRKMILKSCFCLAPIRVL